MNWSFTQQIAIPLERYCNLFLGYNSWTADEIENGKFIHALIAVLQAKFYSLKNFENFTFICNPYVSIPASKIPQEKAIEIFRKFKEFIDIK